MQSKIGLHLSIGIQDFKCQLPHPTGYIEFRDHLAQSADVGDAAVDIYRQSVRENPILMVMAAVGASEAIYRSAPMEPAVATDRDNGSER